jgi:hypothetical protein
MQHIIGTFDTRAEAEAAIERLNRIGIGVDAISVAVKQGQGQGDATSDVLTASTGTHDLAEEGAGVGAVSGAAVGTLVGLMVAGSTLVLPGIGTFLVAGPLAAALTGAGFEAGGVIVAVHVSETRAAEVRRIFDEEGSRRTQTA